MDLLKQNVASNVVFSADEWEQFRMAFQMRKVRKKEFLLKEGDICRFEAFVTKGCFRVFHVDVKGMEHVLYFGVEGWWIGDIELYYPSACPALYRGAGRQ